MKRTIKFVGFILALVLCLTSCGGQQRGQQEEIINDVDIPRTHFGITLGASYKEVRSIIQKKIDYTNWINNNPVVYDSLYSEAESRGLPLNALMEECWVGTSDGPFEDIDEKHKIIELDNILSFYNHYDELCVELFDGKVVLIAIEPPRKLVVEIVNKLFEKYPFQLRGVKGLSTQIPSSHSRYVGWPRAFHFGGAEEWFCSNGKTEIAILQQELPKLSKIVYRDVELIKKKKAHWDEVEDLYESERRSRAEKAIEGY